MPDNGGGGPVPPGCDLACQTKIILNGGNIAGVAQTTHQSLVAFFAQGGKLRDGKRLISLLNQIEDSVVEAQKLAAELMGYDGPTGKMLQ
jgi:hypothetical protein